jgi:hypothetical protein
MTATATITYTAEGSPDSSMTFILTGRDIEEIQNKLRIKKNELDEQFEMDPQKSHIRMDPASIKLT